MQAYIINLSIVPLLAVPPSIEETSLQLAFWIVHKLPFGKIAVVEFVGTFLSQYHAVCDGYSAFETVFILVADDGCQVLQICVVFVVFTQISCDAVVICFDGAFTLDFVEFKIALVGHVAPVVNPMSMLFAIEDLSTIFPQFGSVHIQISYFAFKQLIVFPVAFVDCREVIFSFFQFPRAMPDVILPMPHIFPSWKSQFTFSAFFVPQPAALIVDLLIIVEMDSLVGLLPLTPISLVDYLSVYIVSHFDQFSNSVELSVVELPQVDNSVHAIQRLEDVDAHIVHGILFPETYIPIAILENVNTVPVLDVAVALTIAIAIQVHEAVFFFDFLVCVRQMLHRSFMWRKQSTSSVKLICVYWASYWLILRMLCSCFRLLISSLWRSYF